LSCRAEPYQPPDRLTGLVQMASSHVQHMQKALDQMNLQLHHVISDITGLTGITILKAILAGERAWFQQPSVFCLRPAAPEPGP
jgi:hypothetical protein